MLVLLAAGLLFAEGGGDDGGVVALVALGVSPHEAGFAVGVEHVGGEPVHVGRVDARGLQDLVDDSGAVGPVLGEGLAGPVPGDQGAAAATGPWVPDIGFTDMPMMGRVLRPRENPSRDDAVPMPHVVLRGAKPWNHSVRSGVLGV
jgi:hypothetical protein